MSKWYAFFGSSSGFEEETENWKKLHVGGSEGISCQHLPVMVTNLLQKH